MNYFRYLFLIIILLTPSFSHAGFLSILGHSETAHNALVEAADVSNKEYVERLIKNGAPVDGVNADKQTALMKASLRGNQDITKTLLNAHANVNLQDKFGNTALHYAAAHDHIDVSQELIKKGALTDIVNKHGKTALQEAIDSKSVNVARLIDPNAIVAVQSQAMFPAVAAVGLSGKAIAVGAAAAAVGGGAAVAASGGGGSSAASSGGSGGGSSGGSSGGDSGGDSGGSTTTSITIPNAPQNLDPNSFVTAEFINQGGLGQIKANYAYARGYTGSGIIVGVVDSGVDIHHPDLAANIVNSGHDFVNNDNIADSDCNSNLNSTPGCWHGTHVAGIIAAVSNGSGVHGVAYNAKILPVRVMDTSGSGTEANVAAGIDYAAQHGARVINLSLGGSDITGVDPFPAITTSIKNALNSGIIIAAATGNDGLSQPDWPARNAGDTSVNSSSRSGAIIAVGSVNAGNSISSFSNYCGDAKQWCLVAPGESIYSTVPTVLTGFNGYGYASGTSMATPQVSGAAAILLAAFPSLTPRQVALLLLNTADDLGAPGVDDVYGHGLLDLEAATRPNGTVVIPLSSGLSGASADFSNSRISTSSAFGSSLKNSGISFAIMDSYNRLYTVGLSDITGNNTSKTKASDSFTNFADPIIGKVEMSDVGGNVSMGLETIDNDKQLITQPGQDQPSTSYFSMVTQVDGVKQAVNYNIPVAQTFGFGAVKELDGGTFLGDALHGNPYLALSSDGISSLSSFAFNDNHIRTNFVMFSGKNADSGDTTSGMASEIAGDFSGLAIASQFGYVNEQNSFLGSHSSGAFAIGNDTTPTWFYNISTSLNIAENTRLFGLFSEGFTKPDDATNSLISDISQIKSRSAAIGIMRDSNFIESDLLGFSVSSPLHVVSGSANISVPYSADVNGNIYTQNQNLNLTPDAVETDMELFYKIPVEKSTLSFGAIRKLQPGNIQDAAAEDLLMFKFVNKF